MGQFIVYPAIDLRAGKVVRLRQGKADQQTIYSQDPVTVAESWLAQGASWLHLVNLDGAFDQRTQANRKALAEIMRVCQGKVQVQLGGGLRTIDQIETALSLGVSRAILGTRAVQEPAFGVQALERFGGERIAFALDALDGVLMVSGWQSQSGMQVDVLAQNLVQAGAVTVIYTDIRRDGMQTGVDWQNARRLADDTGMAVIASGGVSSLDDIARVRSAGLAGVVVGRALYEGVFSLQEAFDAR
jgi:phosphoribosylformimino-5-aminoimidazole carboxamide ribotide isomerase